MAACVVRFYFGIMPRSLCARVVVQLMVEGAADGKALEKKMWKKFIVERRQIATCHIPLNSVRGTERCQMIEYERYNYTESICLWLKKIKMNSSTKRWTGWKQRQTENCRKTNNKLLAASVAVWLSSVSHHAAEYGAAAANTMFAHDVIQNKLRRALANETSVRLHLIYRWIVWLDGLT